VFVKGAVDGLIDHVTAVWKGARAEPLDAGWRRRILTANDQLAQEGMRVLGVAFRLLRALDCTDADALERDLIFIGLIGMIDPPRPEARDAVAMCKAAGIRPVMVTGDHPLTALAIARELGIADGGRVLTGLELERLPEVGLDQATEAVSIFARVSPEHKLLIVRALQRRGQIVAMTGDGVNDAPALKQADIGIAMGATGTDVTRETADIVLQDDNFATIVAAVAEGRTIYDNIRKFVKFLLTSNAGELWVMLLAPLLGMPLALLPLQILWINLVTDGLPALALSREPAEPDTMRRPPYPPHESVFAQRLGVDVLWVGLLIGVIALGVGYGSWRDGREQWQTMVFTTLTFAQMANVLALRSERSTLRQIGPWSNPALLGAVALTVALQLAVVYLPFLQQLFSTTALSVADLAQCIVTSSSVFVAVELMKGARQRAHQPVALPGRERPSRGRRNDRP
jgi:Ca2+-transporting ATPase